jgi:cyclopropane-fatty-acyl-phospholipid synthase
MNAPEQIKSRRLTLVDENRGQVGGSFSFGIGKLKERIFARLLQQIDAGLAFGTIDGRLPDGTPCILGGKGDGPVAEVHLVKWRAFTRLLLRGSTGWYEAWDKGEWTSPNPVALFDLTMRNRSTMGATARSRGVFAIPGRIAHWLRRNSLMGAKRNIEYHYDLGNGFYSAWLDNGMTYSSAMFLSADMDGDAGLEQAQTQKIDAMLTRLQISEGQSMLEIGCGWGGLAERALQKNRIAYHGITLSNEQRDYSIERLCQFPETSVTLTDYRDVDGRYDAIASLEMVEAVGQEFWPDYLDCISRNLKPGGKAAIQYIRIEDDIFEAYASGSDFIQSYIFPGGMLLSESRFKKLAEERGLQWQDQHDFGLDYAKTLKIWRSRFDLAVTENRLPPEFDDKFVRLWRYYLMYCEGGFRGGGINVSQVTLVKGK